LIRISLRSGASLLLVLAAAAVNACGGSPTQPDPEGPQISCPTPPPPAQAPDSTGAIVLYGAATASQGTPPLAGPTCVPPSGSMFPVGTTTVTCTVTDARAHAAACTFAVVVQTAPTLAFTRFLAFGDSITAGEIVGEGLVTQGNRLVRPLLIDPFLSYPADLTRALSIRYETQQPFVTNAGVPAENTSQGLARLPSALSPVHQQPPQVLLLMEGANDISSGSPSTITPAIQNLDLMVQIARNSGVRVILGTLPPENPNACTGPNVPAGCEFRAGGAPVVAPFNAALKSMAASENVAVADVYQAFNGNVTTLIDFDGLHPTAAGYQVIADTFFGVIEQTLENSPRSSLVAPASTRGFAPHRR
jgi:lysophospholipase L1-like esterase